MWVATLMWTGQRPEHPLVEQSESAFHNALALAMSEMPAGTCDLEAGDLGSYNTSPNFCSVPGSDNSVAVYLHSKGILKVVNDNSAVCEVQEPEGCRNVEFFTFYRNNVPHVGHLKNVLRENDVVQIDYMVGTVGGREEVCCRLVWQGKKPSDVRQTSPAEFGLLLKARTAQEKVLPAPGKLSALANWELAVCLQDPVAPNGHRQIRLERDWLTSKMATPYGKTTTARHPPEPTVYVFLGRKGTVMQVCDSAAMVEAREGQSIREVTVTADCFYREGRTVLTNLNRVLHKGEIVNIDYMVGRMGCKDSIHCNLAWQGRKPQRVPCLSPDEFKEKIIARETNTKGDWEFVRKVFNQINDLVTTQIQTTLHEEIPKVIEHLLDSQQAIVKGRSAQFQQEVLPATLRPTEGARSSGEVQRFASMLPRDESDPRHFRNLAILFNTPAAVEEDLRFLVFALSWIKKDDDTALGYISAHLNNAVRADEGVPPGCKESFLNSHHQSGAGSVLQLKPYDLTDPLRASVFFDKRFIGENRYYDLTKSGIRVGDIVVLDAVKSPPGHRAKYQATRIELLRKIAHTSIPTTKQAAFQPNNHGMTNGLAGTIQAVNPCHAFILFGQGNKDCAYVSIDNVEKSLLQAEKSLNDIFSVGDKVHFDAQPHPKPTSCAKWWATNVKKVQCAELAQANDCGDEALLCDNDIAELLLDLKEFSARRKLSGIRGAFFPNSKNTGVVSAYDQHVMVRVVIAVAYCNGRKIRSFGELLKDCALQDGVDVFIDAVEAEHDVWVATLMWTGERPEHPLVEQSESAFHNALALAMSEMPAGTCDLEAGDLGSYNTSPNFCSVPGSDHSVAVYPHSKGILKVVNDNSAVCEVQEPEGCRSVEFCTFYRSNVPHVGHFKNLLRENDVVQIDYMVGTLGGREEVCCRLVWQGERPSDVYQTSPAEFGLLLKARAAQEHVLPAPGKLSALAEPQSHGNVQGGPSSVPSGNLAAVQKSATSSLPPGPGCSKWPSADSRGKRLLDKQDVIGPSPSSGPATRNVTTYGKATAAPHPPEPTVYVFLGRKGTVMQVCDSAAMVETREGQSIREVTVTADCFYRDGRTVSTNLNRVLHKGEVVNIDYMVGRMGCKDNVHCNLAWQGRKPQGVSCLSPDEFKEKISARGSGSAFIDDLQSTSQKPENSCKDAPRTTAKYSLSQADTRQQIEVHRPPPRISNPGSRKPSQVSIPSTDQTNTKEDWELIAKMVDQINYLVTTKIQTTLHEEVPKVIEHLLDSQRAMIKGHDDQGEGDGGSVAEPNGRQYSLVPGPAGSSTWQPSSASQQRSVTTGSSSGASQTPWGEPVEPFGKQTLQRFTSNLSSVPPKVQPVTVTCLWQPSNALQQARVAANLSPQASQMSWGVAVGQFGQPLSSFNSSPASLPPEVLPATVTPTWQPSNASQQRRVAADLPRQASQMSLGQFGQPLSSFNSSPASVPPEVLSATVRPADRARPSEAMQRYASTLARDESDPPRFRNLGISFDTPAAVEGGLSNVGAWHLDSSSAQQESGPGASSSDYNPEVRFPEAHSVFVGGLLEEPD
ncbi:hypothetical protein HPB49_015036 [Dermacentor silvarum]|uniref:Uncharacterized protein n=1 Tax=Dermacentor silvarum TaxID=543639 RepID=A0ACB8DPN6_DERSI|nr:hypothetical protein HPB49_015036 [Dermacentor silvarum]